MTLDCDNQSAIVISKNPIQYSTTKYPDIRHHFVRELVERKLIKLEYIAIEKQLADILTKSFNGNQFEALRLSLGLCVIK